MPIVTTSSVSHKLTKVNVDMELMTIWCYFTRTINGKLDGGSEMHVEGTDMVSLLMTQAIPNQALGDEITDAIYSMAISKGIIEGTLQ